MGMASLPEGPDTTDIDFSFLLGRTSREPDPEQPDVPLKRRKRAGARQKTVEHLYADLIKAGQVRIVRRAGKPPLIEWL